MMFTARLAAITVGGDRVSGYSAFLQKGAISQAEAVKWTFGALRLSKIRIGYCVLFLVYAILS